jgi:hypothetical protein
LDGSWLAREKGPRVAGLVGAIILEFGRPPENEFAAAKARKLALIPSSAVFSEKH